MDYVTASEPAVRLALAIGSLALMVTVGLLLQVWWMRWRTQRRERARQRVVARWRPLLLRHMVRDGDPLPALPSRDAETVALLWNQLMDGLRGGSHARLRQFGERAGLRVLAQGWIARRQEASQLLGLVTLGHVGHQTDWTLVQERLNDPHPALSLAAARALVQIAPAEGAAELLRMLPQRPDWPLGRVDQLLRMADPAVVHDPLRRLLRRAGLQDLVRWLPLVQGLAPVHARGLLLELMKARPEPEVLAAVLARLDEPEDAVHARQAAQHDLWWVRLRAAAALGRIGDESDLERLTGLMGDAQWWVRYRAAQAVIKLMHGDVERLRALWRSLTDGYARDMLQQAIAEAQA